jgi:hypothetical protein
MLDQWCLKPRVIRRVISPDAFTHHSHSHFHSSPTSGCSALNVGLGARGAAKESRPGKLDGCISVPCSRSHSSLGYTACQRASF